MADIVQFNVGYGIVKSQGITPFIQSVERSASSDVKATTFAVIYKAVFDMCTQRAPYNFSDKLYKKYCEELEMYNKGVVLRGLKAASKKPAVPFLREWNARWKNHTLMVMGNARFFCYLDRFHTKNNDMILPLNEKGYEIYKMLVFDQFQDKAAKSILALIERERNEEDVDRNLLREAVQAFQEMGVRYNNAGLTIYKERLEKEITKHASKFYEKTSRAWMAQDSTPNYLKKAESMLDQEKARCEAYLVSSSTLEPLLNACHRQLLKNHQVDLLEKKTGISRMLTTNALDDLSRLFKLYSRHPQELNPISIAFHDHICREGKRIVSEAAARGENKAQANQQHDPNNGLVSRLIALHHRYEAIVSGAFAKSQVFQKSLKRSFETFINEDNSVARLLAEYVNAVLTKGSQVQVSNADMQGTLENIAYLYQYVHDKDVFERSYQVFLQQRLLTDKCENVHTEKEMISKLKQGNFHWTSKLEGMFKDVQTSKDLLKSYYKKEGKRVAERVKLEINVCTPAWWPKLRNCPKILVTGEIKDIVAAYSEFYHREHPSHQLDWRFEQGTAQVQVKFMPNPQSYKILEVSTYQMILLLLFNAATAKSKYVLTYGTILERTGLSNSQVSHHLLSMAHPTVKVIAKKPNNAACNEAHKFRINPKFTSKKKKIKVPTFVSDKKHLEELDAADRIIAANRKISMDANIVRIMKARKRLKHRALVQAVMEAITHFRPQPLMIKKRIESMIDQEFMERDEDDRGTYKYKPAKGG